MEYIICVDGGGTKTESAAYDHDGKELSREYTGYGNMTLNKEIAVSNILDSIEKCELVKNNEKLTNIYLGIAGIEAGENRKILKEAVEKKFNITPYIYNDAEIAMHALLKGNDGILTIAGTGSISFGISNGVKKRSGGWGHVLGDEGSGYYIALRAFKNMIYEEEEGLENSVLTNEILKKLKLKDIESIKGFIYSSTKDEIASIAKVVAKAAEHGEENAIEILKDAGTEIGKITERVWKRLGKPKKVNIALKGSVITKIPCVRKSFDLYIANAISDAEIIDDDISSTKGGYYIARKNW